MIYGWFYSLGYAGGRLVAGFRDGKVGSLPPKLRERIEALVRQKLDQCAAPATCFERKDK